MLQSLRLKYSILLGYTIPLFLLALVAVVIYGKAKELQQQTALLETADAIVADAHQAIYGVTAMQRAARGYMLDRNVLSRENFANARETYLSALANLQRQIRDPRQIENLKKIENLSNLIGKETETQFALVDAGKVEQAVRGFREGQTTLWAQELATLQEQFVETESQILLDRRAQQLVTINAIPNTLLAGVLVAVALALVLGFWIASRISQTIRNALSVASTTSTEIATTVTEHERTANQQAAMVSETTSTMEELAVSSRQTAEQAASTSTLAENASSLTEEGNRTVRDAVAAIETLKDRIGAVGQQILALSEQTAQVGQIADLVKDLAAQINMLSLNAAVEAARAGEQGKGFAVVAGEVRKLAVETRKSAEQARAIVAAIQKVTDVTIMKTEEGSRTLESVTSLAQALDNLFQSLSESSEQVYRNSQQMVLNAKQQAAAIGQVVEAANSINAGARETAAGLSQTKVGIENLNAATGQLMKIV